MSNGVIELKRLVLEHQAAAEYYYNCCNCFWTGNIPDGATMEQVIMASAGRKRLDALKKSLRCLMGLCRIRTHLKVGYVMNSITDTERLNALKRFLFVDGVDC